MPSRVASAAAPAGSALALCVADAGRARARAVLGRPRGPAAPRRDLRLCRAGELWNLLAGYAGLVSVGQQAFVGLGGYLLFALTMFAGVPPLGDPARRRSSPRSSRCRSRRWSSACAGLFRDRHLGGGGSLPASRLAGVGPRRRLRHEPAGRVRDRHRADGRREFTDLLGRAGACRRGARPDRRCCCARATALR